jgi:hypothetical protein
MRLCHEQVAHVSHASVRHLPRRARAPGNAGLSRAVCLSDASGETRTDRFLRIRRNLRPAYVLAVFI